MGQNVVDKGNGRDWEVKRAAGRRKRPERSTGGLEDLFSELNTMITLVAAEVEATKAAPEEDAGRLHSARG